MFHPYAQLSPVDGHDVLVSAIPGPDGSLVTLWTTAADHPELYARHGSSGGASFARTRTARPVSARVGVFGPQLQHVVAIDELPIAFPEVQVFSDGSVLLVGARCAWTPDDGAEHNAIVYDADGRVERTGVLGDGICHLAVTAADEIWVGYFDEGVLGNFGWHHPEAPPPVGVAGLVRFDRGLRPVWEFDGPEPIVDCYALNLAGPDAWLCYYDAFPLARVRDDTVTTWATPEQVSGVSAIAVDGDRVAFFGGYKGDGSNRLLVGRLPDDLLHVTAARTESLPAQSDSRATSIHARGAVLHMISGRTWFVARPLDPR
ncbi:MAG: hypothetical protein QM662_12105 [Gordonia sp. (in: high G+C Gram-positive bacteria)]